MDGEKRITTPSLEERRKGVEKEGVDVRAGKNSRKDYVSCGRKKILVSLIRGCSSAQPATRGGAGDGF